MYIVFYASDLYRLLCNIDNIHERSDIWSGAFSALSVLNRSAVRDMMRAIVFASIAAGLLRGYLCR